MLHERLRRETADAHARLETGLRLTDPGLSLDRYRAVLEGFYTFLRPWERRVEAALGDPDFTRPRRRAHLLADDLAALGAAPGRVAALPDCPLLPPVDDPARALGSLYVLEGSTLGGQVVSRHLESILGLTDGRGYSFFRGHGAETGAMWRRFGERLAAFSAPGRDDGVVEGARSTFEALERWLCREATGPA